jgi:hypothetical protein
MNDQVLFSIIARIQKLLTLANDGRGNEAEALAAAGKAQELLEKYNLDLAAVESAGGKGDDSTAREKATHEEKTGYKYRRNLMVGIAALNFLHVQPRQTYTGTRAKFAGYTLIGRKVNVAIARTMYEYLVMAIDRVIAEEIPDNRKRLSKYAYSMRVGIADRLVERLKEKREAEIAAQKEKDAALRSTNSGAKSNALTITLGDYVRDEEDANNDFRNGWAPGTTKARRVKQEQDSAAWTIRYNEFMADGWSSSVASYLAFGYSVEDAKRLGKPKTAAQEAAEDRKWENYWKRQESKARTAASKFDATGYHKGRELGNDISLAPQIDKNNTKVLK